MFVLLRYGEPVLNQIFWKHQNTEKVAQSKHDEVRFSISVRLNPGLKLL